MIETMSRTLKSITATVRILKARFPNLTAEESVELASAIVMAIAEATNGGGQ